MGGFNVHRRKFIINSAVAASGAALFGLPAFGQVSANDVIQVGLIGAGARGAGLATLLKQIPQFKLVAVCDVIPENLAKGISLASPGAKAYTNYKQLIDDKNVDAVIVATPLYLHCIMAKDALSAGKHVYSEKTMAYDIKQSIEMPKLMQVHPNLIYQVGFQYRYYKLYHKIKEIIAQNWLGKVTHFECQYNNNSNWRRPVKDPKQERLINWRMYREYCGGPLSELCAHEIDAMNFMLDSHPVKVTGIGDINYWKDGRDTYDNVRTIYEYQNGVKASVTSVLSNSYNSYCIRILGDKATVEILRNKALIYPEHTSNEHGTVDGVTGATIAVRTQGKPIEVVFDKPGETSAEPTIYCLQDFAQCIINKKKPLSNAETGRDTSIAIHMGNAAMDTQTFQTWKPEYSA